MDIQDLYRSCYYVAFLTGLLAGYFANRFRPSGKRALAVALVALVLVLARGAVNTVGGWFDIAGIAHLFC
jgi:hypothetical protein